MAACFAVLLILTSHSVSFAQEDCLEIAAIDEGISHLVVPQVTEALVASGICLSIRYLPVKRAEISLKQGDVDADLIRIHAYQNVVSAFAKRIEVPILEGHGLLVVKDPKITKIEDLDPGMIGSKRGVLWAHMVVEDHHKLTIGNSYDHLLKMLERDRIKAVLIDNLSWQSFITVDSPLKTQVVFDGTVYMYLAQKKQYMSEKITEALLKYKEEHGGFLPNSARLRQ